VAVPNRVVPRHLHRAVRSRYPSVRCGESCRFAAPLALLDAVAIVGALGPWFDLAAASWTRCGLARGIRHLSPWFMAPSDSAEWVAPSPAAVGRRRPDMGAPSNTFTVPFAAAAPSGSACLSLVSDRQLPRYPAEMNDCGAVGGVEAGGLSTSDHCTVVPAEYDVPDIVGGPSTTESHHSAPDDDVVRDRDPCDRAALTCPPRRCRTPDRHQEVMIDRDVRNRTPIVFEGNIGRRIASEDDVLPS